MSGANGMEGLGEDPTSVLGDGVGAKFGASVKRLLQGSFDPNTFLNDEVYGNLRTTHPKYLKAKRDRVGASFIKIVNAVAWLLKDGVPARDHGTPSYRSTREKAAVIADWRELIRAHPHQWPASPIFTYILELRDITIGIDKTTHGSLSNNLPDRFRGWNDTEKVLLPSDVPHKFHGLDMAAAFSRVKDLFEQSAIVVVEFCTPPYGWKVSIEVNIKKMLSKSGFAPQGLGEIIRNWAQKEIYKQYLSKLGIIEHKLDFSKLLPEVAREGTIGTAKSIMESMLAKKDLAPKVFGSEAVKDMADLLGELKRKEALFEGPKEEEAGSSSLPEASDLKAAAAAAPSDEVPSDCASREQCDDDESNGKDRYDDESNGKDRYDEEPNEEDLVEEEQPKEERPKPRGPVAGIELTGKCDDPL
jgi:hypothetical protein